MIWPILNIELYHYPLPVEPVKDPMEEAIEHEKQQAGVQPNEEEDEEEEEEEPGCMERCCGAFCGKCRVCLYCVCLKVGAATSCCALCRH